jgi:hypothetical protein
MHSACGALRPIFSAAKRSTDCPKHDLRGSAKVDGWSGRRLRPELLRTTLVTRSGHSATTGPQSCWQQRCGNNKIGRVDCRVRPINFRLLARQFAKAPPLAAAETPEAAAAAATNAAATAATATAAAATPATATAAAAAATTATPRYLLLGATVVFLVEEMERRQTDVRDFLFTQRDRLCRREVEFLRDICSRRA